MSVKRVPPSVAMKQEVAELLQRGRGEGLPLSEFIRTAARSCLQEAVEPEVTDCLGRGHYQRGARQRAGYRNGYEEKSFPSAEGPVQVQLPQVRATQEPLRSQLAQSLAATPGALGKLVVGM